MDSEKSILLGKKFNIKHKGMLAGLANFNANNPEIDELLTNTYLCSFVADKREGSCLNNIKTMLSYLAADGAGKIKERATALMRWNKLFSCQWVKLEDQKISFAECQTLLEEVYDSGQAISKAFNAFCTTVKDAHLVVNNSRNTLAKLGLGTQCLYNVIHFFHQGIFDFNHITPIVIQNLYRFGTDYPPRSKFQGFISWGRGDHGNPAENRTNHFLEHVLDHDPLKKLAWLEECAVWFKVLKIEVTRNKCKECLVNVPVILNLFPIGDADVLPNDKVVQFVEKMREGNHWTPQLQQFFVNSYEKSYCDYALALSKSMENACVQTTGGRDKVFISGSVKNMYGSFFVIGRYSKDGTLGMSSCYVARDINKQLSGRVEIWPLI